MPDTTRARLEAEAAELYEYAELQLGSSLIPKREALALARETYIRAKTVSAEQVEAAAKAIWYYFVGSNLEGFDRPAYAYDREKCMEAATTAFRAAGFLIEGDNDE